MSIIQKAIDELLEWDEKYAPNGHDIKFFLPAAKESFYVSTGLSKDFPLQGYFIQRELTALQIDKILQISLQFCKEEHFRFSFGSKYVADLRLERDYIEELITNIFQDVFDCKEMSALEYKIFAI